jgi:pyruvate,orthophosphate dikinase
MASSARRVYSFIGSSSPGSKEMKNEVNLSIKLWVFRLVALSMSSLAPPETLLLSLLTLSYQLGGKGANLCEMARLGLNVPPGFVISTSVCSEFFDLDHHLPDGLMDDVRAGIQLIETNMNTKFGDPSSSPFALPLLLSVRSGAAVSMPGMMDTVLNLGLNDTNVISLASKYGARFAYDSYRRLLQMFGDVVLGIPSSEFEACLTKRREAAGVKTDIELPADDLVLLIEDFKAVYLSHNLALPQDPYVQLEMGIKAVFASWMIPRAIKYRTINKIKGLAGTAVNVQAMVYGNLTQDDSASGVCFTRSPVSGIKELYGEVLFCAQGEEVVAGTRTPFEIKSELASRLPTIYNELLTVTTALEKHMRQMQDVEFTIQSGKLFILQCRSGKRTGQAAVRIAIDMVNEGIVSEREAILMVEPKHLSSLLHPTFLDKPGEYDDHILARGLAASPGAAVGRIVFTAKEAEEWKARGQSLIDLITSLLTLLLHTSAITQGSRSFFCEKSPLQRTSAV